jgi:hypothetical protein
MKQGPLLAGSSHRVFAQRMKVLGQQNPADQQKACLVPKLPQDLDEAATEAGIIEELRATTGAGSDKLQVSRFEVAPLAGC